MKHPVYVVSVDVHRSSTGQGASMIMNVKGTPEDAATVADDHLRAMEHEFVTNQGYEMTIVRGQIETEGQVRSTYAEVETTLGSNVVSTFTYVISKFSIEINEDE